MRTTQISNIKLYGRVMLFLIAFLFLICLAAKPAFATGATVSNAVWIGNDEADKGENQRFKLSRWGKSESYTIKYELGEGGVFPTGQAHPTTAKVDQTIDIGVPTRVGYTFAGWDITGMDTSTHTIDGKSNNSNKIYACKGKKYKNLSMVGGQVTFTARWSVNIYKITYDLDGGTGTPDNPISAGYTDVIEIAPPRKLGYEFVGWEITGMSSNSVNHYIGDEIVITSTYPQPGNDYTTATKFSRLHTNHDAVVKFKAHWSLISYNIEFENLDGEDNRTGFSVKYNELFEVKSATSKGMEFLGWSITGMDGTQHYKGTSKTGLTAFNDPFIFGEYSTWYENLTSKNGSTVTFKAIWKVYGYDIKYNMNGGLFTMKPTTHALFEEWFDVEAPTKTGYSFNGWTITGMSAGVDHYFGDGGDKNNKDTASGIKQEKYKNLNSTDGGVVTFTAEWIPNKYTIVFENTYETLPSITAEYGKDVTIAIPTKPDREFVAWTISGMSNEKMTTEMHYVGSPVETTKNSTANSYYDPDVLGSGTYFRDLSTVDGAVIRFTANWKQGTYKIIYDYDGGSITGLESRTNRIEIEKEFYVEKPTKDKFCFDHWEITGMSGGRQHVLGNKTTDETSAESDADIFVNLGGVGSEVHFKAVYNPLNHLNDYSWEMIRQIAKEGRIYSEFGPGGTNCLNDGCCKEIELSAFKSFAKNDEEAAQPEQKIYVNIIGLGYDTPVDGEVIGDVVTFGMQPAYYDSGKKTYRANQSGTLTNCIKPDPSSSNGRYGLLEKFAIMNAGESNRESLSMNTTLQNVMMAMPAELKNMIVTVSKNTSVGGGTEQGKTIGQTQQQLFLFSAEELTGQSKVKSTGTANANNTGTVYYIDFTGAAKSVGSGYTSNNIGYSGESRVVGTQGRAYAWYGLQAANSNLQNALKRGGEWLLRSPSSANNTNYLHVGTTGSMNGTTTSANAGRGVSFGFVIAAMNYKPILAPSEDWYKGTLDKKEITSIKILKNYATGGKIDDVWNADAFNGGSVRCFRTGTELIIAGNGTEKIYANANSSNAFAGFEKVSSIEGLNLISTENTQNMYGMFKDFAKNVTGTVSFNGINNWNVEKVVSFACVFEGFMPNVENFQLNLENWKTYKARSMASMFNGAGKTAKTWSVTGISEFETDAVTDLSGMFANVASRATAFNMDLTSWNLGTAGNLNDMFVNAASNTSVANWLVKIPEMTNTEKNKATNWYGKNNTVSAIPATGKYFILPAIEYNVIGKSTSGKTIYEKVVSGTFMETKDVNPEEIAGYRTPGKQSVTWDSAVSKNIEFTHEIINYNITWVLDGGRYNGTGSYPSNYNVESAAYTIPEPIRDHYDFIGWTGSNGSARQKVVTIPTGSTGDKSYTATWTAKQYTITYNMGGGLNSAANRSTYTIEDENISLASPTKGGYKFAGWTGDESNTPTVGLIINTKNGENRTYTAHWELAEKTVWTSQNFGETSDVFDARGYDVIIGKITAVGNFNGEDRYTQDDPPIYHRTKLSDARTRLLVDFLDEDGNILKSEEIASTGWINYGGAASARQETSRTLTNEQPFNIAGYPDSYLSRVRFRTETSASYWDASYSWQSQEVKCENIVLKTVQDGDSYLMPLSIGTTSIGSNANNTNDSVSWDLRGGNGLQIDGKIECTLSPTNPNGKNARVKVSLVSSTGKTLELSNSIITAYNLQTGGLSGEYRLDEWNDDDKSNVKVRVDISDYSGSEAYSATAIIYSAKKINY